MNDRELLELAAKASKRAVGVYLGDELGFEAPFFGEWNPLNDDGDAMRLAIRLGISIHFNIVNVAVSTPQLVLDRIFIIEDTLSEDCDIATRRAIVRAAAAIGEFMP